MTDFRFKPEVFAKIEIEKSEQKNFKINKIFLLQNPAFSPSSSTRDISRSFDESLGKALATSARWRALIK